MGIIDVKIGDAFRPEDESSSKANAEKRPFIGLRLACANDLYLRIYRNQSAQAYQGRCPLCLRNIKIGIGSHGTNSRFFIYDCGRLNS